MNINECNSEYNKANKKSDSVTNYQPGQVAPISRYSISMTPSLSNNRKRR